MQMSLSQKRPSRSMESLHTPGRHSVPAPAPSPAGGREAWPALRVPRRGHHARGAKGPEHGHALVNLEVEADGASRTGRQGKDMRGLTAGTGLGMRAGPSPTYSPAQAAPAAKMDTRSWRPGAIPVRLATWWPGKLAKLHRDRCMVWPMTRALL